MARKAPPYDDRWFNNLFPFTGPNMSRKKRLEMWKRYFGGRK